MSRLRGRRRLHHAGLVARALRRDTRGTAAIEFALLSSLFFIGIFIALDFSSLYLERSKLNEAVSGAAVNAFSTADNVDFTALPGYVRALANNQTVSVTASCNGAVGSCTNLNRSCACLHGDGTFVVATCGNVCSGTGVTPNSTAGYYLTVQAEQAFSPVIVPKGVLGGTQINQRATVRLQ